MSSRDYELFYFDIYVAMIKIELVSLKYKNEDELLSDFVAWDSIIREFEIIGEATNILLKESKIDEEYRVVVDFRNKIIHHYFGIDAQAVWSIIKYDLVEYKNYILSLITKIDEPLYSELLKSTMSDNQRYKDIKNKLKELKR